MDCSIWGLSVPHHFPKSTHVHGHCISDAIQPSQPLMPSSPSALNLSQHQELFQWVSCSHQMTMILDFQLQIEPHSTKKKKSYLNPMYPELSIYLYPAWVTLYLAEDLFIHVSITRLMFLLMIIPMFFTWHLRVCLAHNGCSVNVEISILELQKYTGKKHYPCLNPTAHPL